MELLKKYFAGLGFLVFDELSSFYRWITSILAMIISLWVYNVDDALPFSILLFFAITNIIVCAWWKGEVEDTKKEELQTKVYVINFILLLVIGCIINFTLMAIIVGVLIVLAIIYFVSNNFRIMSDNIFYIFWGIVFGLILPLGGLIYFIFQTTIPMYLKVLISVIYAVFDNGKYVCYLNDGTNKPMSYNLEKVSSIIYINEEETPKVCEYVEECVWSWYAAPVYPDITSYVLYIPEGSIHYGAMS